MASLMVASEIVAGLWFLSGAASRAGRIVASTLLAGFAAVNFWKAAYGEPSCGCFGSVTVPPLLVGVVEIVWLAVLALLPCRKPWTELDGHVLSTIGLAAAVAGVLYLAQSDRSGTEPPRADFTLDVGSVTADAKQALNLTWTNPNDERIQLTFLQSSCGCLEARTLPVWVVANQSIDIPITFTTPAKPDDFARRFTLVTSRTTLSGVVQGRVSNLERTPGR